MHVPFQEQMLILTNVQSGSDESRKSDVTRLEAMEIWIWRKIEKIKWTDKVMNIEVLGQVNKVDGYYKKAEGTMDRTHTPT